MLVQLLYFTGAHCMIVIHIAVMQHTLLKRTSYLCTKSMAKCLSRLGCLHSGKTWWPASVTKCGKLQLLCADHFAPAHMYN